MQFPRGVNRISRARGLGISGTSISLPSGAMFQYDFLTPGSGDTLSDLSGNGNTATRGWSGTFKPTWSATGMTFAPTNGVTLPDVENSVGTFHLCCTFGVPPVSAGSNFPVVMGTSGSQTLWGWVSSGLYGFHGGGKAIPTFAPSKKVLGTNVLSLVLGSNPKWYWNGVETPAYWVQPGSFTLSSSAANWVLGLWPGIGYGYTGTMYYAVAYPTQQTTTQINQVVEYIRSVVSARGVTVGDTVVTTRPNLIFEGDSLMAGNTSNDAADPASQCVGNLTNPVNHVNLGIGGQLSSGINGAKTTRVIPLLGQYSGTNVVIPWVGSNDIATSAGLEDELETNLGSYLDSLKAAYPAVKTVGVTMISRNAANPSFNTERATFNSTLAGWVGTKLDALADPAGNATLGGNSAHSNTTYFTDGIHLTTLGSTIVSNEIRTALGTLGIT